MTLVEDTGFAACRDYIKDRLLKPAPVLRHHEEEKLQIFHLFERTVYNGESNSALLIGPRSSGKSILVKDVISELDKQDHFKKSAVIVHLNGLIHTDDAVALKAIASQMGLNNVYEGQTLGSFAANLSFFLDCLKSGDREMSKSTIMILDEFDLFCCRTRQTLLYNLFDVAQSAEAPLCVLGLTCRLDVAELLEKRVKSRFSNRQIYIFPESGECGLQELTELSCEFLSLPAQSERNLKLTSSFVRNWNTEMKLLFSTAELQDMIQSLHHFDITEQRFRLFLTLVVSRLHGEHRSITLKDFSEVYKTMMQDVKVNILESLSVLELCLVVAMKHHSDIYDGEPFNFEMILRMYLKFINQNSLDYTTDRSVIIKAFEKIVNLEFIIPVKSRNNASLKEHEMYRLVLLPEQIKLGVQCYQKLPTEVCQWLKNSIS